VGIGRVEVRPDPMNPTGIVAFETSRTGRVRIQIYDVAGRLVRSLWDGMMPGGPAEVLLDGRNDHGSALGSGVYYYRVETVDRVRTGRLTILK
jgi:flagellar hook assembly protein FlgD